MTPFNLSAAKAGAPVMTRSGLHVRLFCFDARGRFQICGLIDDGDQDVLIGWNNEGRLFGHLELGFDLVMKPQAELDLNAMSKHNSSSRQ